MRPDPIFPGERFDDHAVDLDAWRADQERLRVLESDAHARLDRAAESIRAPLVWRGAPGQYVSALDGTDPLGITFCPVCREPAHATETDDEGRHPGCRDSDALDEVARICARLDASVGPVTRGSLREVLGWIRDAVRSTGRGC